MLSESRYYNIISLGRLHGRKGYFLLNCVLDLRRSAVYQYIICNAINQNGFFYTHCNQLRKK